MIEMKQNIRNISYVGVMIPDFLCAAAVDSVSHELHLWGGTTA